MQTVNDEIDPLTVRQTLDEFAAGISAITAAEKDLMEKKAAKLAALRREARQHSEFEAARLDARAHGITEEFAQRMELARLNAEARTGKAQTAYHASKSSLARRMMDMKDRRIGKTQGEVMLRRQNRQQELDHAAAAHEEFLKTLLDARAARREIRKRVLSACRTFTPLLRSWFDGKRAFNPVEIPATPEETRAALLETLDEAGAAADSVVKLPLPRFFRMVPLTALVLLVGGMHVWYALRAGGGGLLALLPSLLIAEGVLLAFWGVAFASAKTALKRAAAVLSKARTLETAAESQSAARHAALKSEIQDEEAGESQLLSETFRESGQEWRARMAEGQRQLDERLAGIPARLERLYQKQLAKIETAREAELGRAREESEERSRAFAAELDEKVSAIEAEFGADLDKLETTWRANVLPLQQNLLALDPQSRTAFPEWNTAFCETWEPPAVVPDAVRIGRIEVDAAKLAKGLPAHAGLSLENDGGRFAVPFSLAFPDEGSLLLETDGPDDGTAARVLHAAALRLLASHPPGRASFLFIDPVGLGKDFAGLMHLADYEETLITHRIWTQTTHIEERLAEINEHIEKVIQMYLRDEFADIHAYNERAGAIAEKYRFLVIAGFPAAFSDTAAKRLRSIAASGARCGVHLLIQRDSQQAAPGAALDEELRRVCRRLTLANGMFYLTNAPTGADTVVFDPPPTMRDSVSLVHRIGRASVDSIRVKVPFDEVAPQPDAEWSLDTAEELRVPIGRTGAKKLQMLAIGKGTRQHVLVAGKTGSGKSTLFHVIITNLARWASPEQVEFYLVDFKKGVEFKCYAVKKLPHARVVAIESDREFALSVLQRVDAELRRRGDLFRKAGAQDVAGYKRTADAVPMPRTLLLVDEFQEFFTEDDGVAQEASLLLDRIVRQGRAFGIHVILGSQTLGGAYTLARATLGQMVIRIALQCNETDAHLIMDDDNPAPRMLTRPGEGIYNDQAGSLAANSPFQIVWLPENERDDVLDEVRAKARASGTEPQVPIVFEGNAPADIRDNLEIAELMRSKPASRPKKANAWLGAPNSIKGPTEAVFQRQSGSHMLVVSQSTERSLAQLSISLAALAMQYPAGQVEFIVLDPHAAEAVADDCFQRLAAALPNRVRIGGPSELADLMNSLAAELSARAATSGKDAAEVFLIIHDLQRFKALRPDDDFRFSLDDDAAIANPAKVFADLLGEGGPSGMHVIASIDTWNNVSRWIPRKLIAEFEMRVLFQMSANDSANLIDSPAASALGLHRALFHNEHLGTLETFRPYALPDAAWFEEIAAYAESRRA